MSCIIMHRINYFTINVYYKCLYVGCLNSKLSSFLGKKLCNESIIKLAEQLKCVEIFNDIHIEKADKPVDFGYSLRTVIEFYRNYNRKIFDVTISKKCNI